MKSHKIFRVLFVLRKCFNSFILPCLKYCSLIWSSVVASHLQLLNKIVRAYKVFFLDIKVNLWHCRSVSSLSMLYKVFHIPNHSLNLEFPNLFRNVQSSNCLTFPFEDVIHLNNLDHGMSFLVQFFKPQELQKFANYFLLG